MKTELKIKNNILDYVFKAKDGASWNELSEMLNELIEPTKKTELEVLKSVDLMFAFQSDHSTACHVLPPVLLFRIKLN